MTIPIQPVNINPQFVPNQQTPGMQLLLRALEQRQEIELRKKKLAQDQEQFELNKRIAGSEIEGQDIINAEKKRKLKEEEQDTAAQDEALQIFTGNLTRVDDMDGWGEVIAGVKDRRVGKHLMAYITGLFGARGAEATARKTGAEATGLETANTADATVQRILTEMGPRLNTPRGQREAIASVAAAAGSESANQLANAFNAGGGRYSHYAGPDGFLYIIDTKTGDVRQSKPVGTRAGNMMSQEAIRRGAETIVELIDEGTALLRQDKDADIDPVLAHTAEGSRVLGMPLAGGANLLRTDTQEQFRLIRTRFAHNYVGLLPHSRSAANLLQNLTESYFAPSGSGKPNRATAQRDRLRLRAVMAQLAAGKLTDMSRIPGFAQAVQAAAAEGAQVPAGAPGQTPPNPDEWAQGTPP